MTRKLRVKIRGERIIEHCKKRAEHWRVIYDEAMATVKREKAGMAIVGGEKQPPIHNLAVAIGLEEPTAQNKAESVIKQASSNLTTFLQLINTLDPNEDYDLGLRDLTFLEWLHEEVIDGVRRELAL